LPSIVQGMKFINNLKIINLQNTNLNNGSLIKLVSKISFRLESLDVSHNPEINMEGYKFLTETVIVNHKYSEFRSLNIEGNVIGY